MAKKSGQARPGLEHHDLVDGHTRCGNHRGEHLPRSKAPVTCGSCLRLRRAAGLH